MNRGKLLLVVLALVLVPLLVGCGTNRFTPRGWSGLAIDDGVVYAALGDGQILGLDSKELVRKNNQELPIEVGRFPGGDKQPLGPIYGPPVVRDGIIYFGTFTQRDGGRSGFLGMFNRNTKAQGSVYAYDIKSFVSNGIPARQWQYSTGGAVVGGPTVTDEMVVFGSADGLVHAIDRETREPQWIFRTGDEVWGSPTVSDGTVYVGSLDHTLYAIDLEEGTENWSFETSGAIAGQPLVIDGVVYVGSFDRKLYALNAATGQPVWNQPFKGDHWFWAEPIRHNSNLYVGSMGGTVYAVKISTGGEVWSSEPGGQIVVPPVVTSRFLVVATDDETIHFLSLKNGTSVGTCYLDSPVRAKLIVDGDIVYLSTLDGNIRALDSLCNGWVFNSKGDD